MSRLQYLIPSICLIVIFGLSPGAYCADELLPPDQAFMLSVEQKLDDTLQLHWDIADGYYLYRNKFKFVSNTKGIETGPAEIPPGKTQHDEYFGDVKILRGQIEVSLPLTITEDAPDILALGIRYQGCADIGVCYPPINKELNLKLPRPPQIDAAQTLPEFTRTQQNIGFNLVQDDLLPADQAFRFFADVKNPNTIRVNWVIADGYYLYREKFKFEIAGTPGITLGKIDIPHGKQEHDEAFGDVEIFHHEVGFDLPLIRNATEAVSITLTAHFQGCADRGVCYPPMDDTVVLELPAAQESGISSTPSPINTALSEQDQIAMALQQDSLILTIASFFGFGLLLSFTPCVFPMIPILSGIIVGQGESISTRRAFFLSLCYVLASAITYTIFGILAGLFGSSLNLQSVFQTPAVIIPFSAVFVLLALSMFGFYTLQMPVALQTRLSGIGNDRKGGTAIAAATMGALSALIVGPCVAAPLAGALIYIGQTGDATFGGLALFAMGLGMGFPLLIIGTSAGKLLPKAGTWMNATKAVFGVVLLGVAVWLLERIIPVAASMLLWAALLIISAVYLRAIDALPESASGWIKLWKGCGIIMMTAGILLIIGVASGSRDPFRPLNKLTGGNSKHEIQNIVFTPIHSSKELDSHLQEATRNGQWVMLDYYADWCISCKEMEYYTFSDPRVQQALSQVVLVQADVTQNNAENKELLDRFDLIGPPAILFFEPGSREHRLFRVVGYKDADSFLDHLNQFLSNA